MKATILPRRIVCVFLMIVTVGSFLGTPTHTVLAKPLSATFTGCAGQAQIPAAECAALVALYNRTNGAGWSNHTGWLEANTPCSWYGVSCEDSGTNVTDLYMENNHLVGSIPPELDSLTKLEWLGLNTNQLTGTIPPRLGNLTTLYWLYLDYNQLTGSIPAQLGNLVNLTDLELEHNQLTGPIPTQLVNLVNLTNLDLSFNRLSGSIPPQLVNLPKIASFFLSNNQLSGVIPTKWTHPGWFQLLDLSHNRLSGPIPTQLSNMTSLHYLVLGENTLSGPFPAELGSMTGLLTLDLGNNQLSGEIPAAITNLTNLTSLTLSCGLDSSDPAVIAFVDALIPGWQNNLCLPSVALTSVATQDGWIIEANETSGQGGTKNDTASTINVGDNAARRQYLGILSFSSGAALPDTAVITKVLLKVKRQGVIGVGDPVAVFQGFMVDVRKGFFGSTPMLQIGDFQAAANESFGPFLPVPTSNWYTIDLTGAKDSINKSTAASGVTQMRLRFKLDDNDNSSANYLSIFSGSGPVVSRPQLIVEYYVP